MVVFTADDFQVTTAEDDLTEMLIRTLIRQTAGRSSEFACNRWRRKLERWRNLGTPDAPRLVVVIDGLNQRPQIDWARLIEAMGAELDRIGGRLVVTSRTAYYTTQVSRRLLSAVLEVNVPEWTNAERDAILAARGIKGGGLRAPVAESLRNPRLLGIAVELLQSAQIEELEELSVSRLLFEHMRVHERDAPSPRPAHEFARRLQSHAREILDRVTAQRRDDLKVFHGGLEAVTDGRFFITVAGDLTRYSLDDHGLTLALGFAVLDELRAAVRNGNDLNEALEAMFEPISALDRSAEVAFAALTVACLDDTCGAAIGAAIVGAFAEMQNPNADELPAFVSLATKCPEPFMHAARRLSLQSARQPNFDWIEAALHAAKADDRSWSIMTPLLQCWLAYYSLAPEARMYRHRSHDPAEEVEEERLKRRNEIETKMAVLSGSERELLGTLVRNDNGDLATLTRLALTLIAGKPVASFAVALAHWSFGNALNAGHGAPYKEFTHLVRLNRRDWPQSRDAILKACSLFEAADISRTGKWALANLLQATGNPDDAARGEGLVEELTAGRPKFEGWRRVEKYCASDPCDPKSARPDNITETAKEYAAIDVSKIRLHLGNSGADHFFAMARPGIARFESLVGIDKHREFIANVLERNGFPLRQGMFAIHDHNALVTHEHAQRMVDRIRSGSVTAAVEGLSENERWIVSQYHLLLAFPLLSAVEQIEAMLSEHADDSILVELMEVAKSLDETTFAALMDRAIRDNDERAQFILLAFGRSSATPILPNVRRHLATFAQCESERVRTQALALIAAIGDEMSIEAIAKSGWNAASITRDDSLEIWYGSCVILEGAALGMIPHDEALNRIAPELYGRAARRLGGNAARDVSRRIDASIKRAAGLTLDIPVPDIEVRDTGAEPPRYLASEKPTASSSPIDVLRCLSESNEAFEERQKRIEVAFDAFKAALTRGEASIILDRLGLREFDAIAASDRKLAESWYDLFIDLPKARRAPIHNLALLLAHGLAEWNPDKAVQLFTVLREGEPFVRMTYGRAGITLDAMSIWSAKDHPALEGLRFDRLDNAGNDHEIALEVLAALRSGKQTLLKVYVEMRLQAEHPSAIARALMVAGLSEPNAFNDEVLARYESAPGFLGRAQAAAMYAYARNIWSAYWLVQMGATLHAEDFWRYSVLLEKVVDGRVDVQSNVSDDGEPYRLFWPSVQSKLQLRYKKRGGQREKNLFGEDAPSKIFLQ
jgi:hypothetical protein